MAENKDSKQKIAIEIGLNTDQYALLDKKARQFQKMEKIFLLRTWLNYW